MALTLTREQHLELYYYMRLNRQLEERMVRLFRQNKIVGGLYLQPGPGSDFRRDRLRARAARLARAHDPQYRRAAGERIQAARHFHAAHGQIHFTDAGQGWHEPFRRPESAPRHFAHSMLGDLIPVMTGVAMAGRYLGQKIVTMTWIGDGGSSTGVFHEGLNLAAVQKAPFVLIVENNQWAYSTPVEKQSALRESRRPRAGVWHRAAPSWTATTCWPLCARRAKPWSTRRAGNGPVLIEAKTMRMLGHAQHDSAEYVPKAMLESWKKRDPLARFEKVLTEKKLGTRKRKKKSMRASRAKFAPTWNSPKTRPSRRPNRPRQGVYCEGCHTMEADWQRPKEEVMPPRLERCEGSEWPQESRRGNRRRNGARRPPACHASRARTPKAGKPGKRSRKRARRSRERRGTLDHGPKSPISKPSARRMFEEMERDPAVVLLGEDIGVYGGAFKATEGLLERFGWERVIDTPISERAIVGAALRHELRGPAARGGDAVHRFHRLRFNQITNFVAKSHYRWGAPVPMVMRGPRAAACTAGRFIPRIRKCISCTRRG